MKSSYFSFVKCCKRAMIEPKPRSIKLSGDVLPRSRIRNVVKNQKYSILTFLPHVLWNQFKIFFNFFFLLITLSQFVPQLQVGNNTPRIISNHFCVFFVIIHIKLTNLLLKGFLFTYLTPLAFVIALTMLKEFFEDYQRYKRDKEANSAIYRYFKLIHYYLLAFIKYFFFQFFFQ